MVVELKKKYFNLLKSFQYSLFKINNFGYFYIYLWIVQCLIISSFFLNIVSLQEISIFIFMCLCSIHLSVSVLEILNDYIFDNYLKQVFTIFFLLSTLKFIV